MPQMQYTAVNKHYIWSQKAPGFRSWVDLLLIWVCSEVGLSASLDGVFFLWSRDQQI